VYEAGNSVPYTGKLLALAKHQVVAIIDKTLKDDARKYFDIESFLQFKNTQLRAAPSSELRRPRSRSTPTAPASVTNNVALGTGHIKAIVDTAKERNIPPYTADDYVGVSHPTTFSNLKNSLETIHQYTETGLAHIFNGEIGRYESCRFIEQTFIPKGGAANSTTFDPWSNTQDAWTTA
jgi:N4-gp56 family major capsid protein